MPKVSIIIPVYNCEGFIEEALQSVMAQTEKDLEIIVVNDGSTDSTGEIVRQMASREMRIVLYSQPNSGRPSMARNTGLRFATGEYICFLDGDDSYCREKIALQLDFMERHPDIDTLFHDVSFITENGCVIQGTYLEKAGFREAVLSGATEKNDEEYLCEGKALFNFMCTKVTTILMSSIMLRKNKLYQQPSWFPEDLVLGEDVDLWFRLVKTGGVGFLNKTLSHYRQHSGSVTKRPDRNLGDATEAHLRNYARTGGYLTRGERKAYRKRIAADLFDTGYLLCREGKSRQGRSSYLQSLRWSLGLPPVLALAKSYLPAGIKKTDTGGDR